MHAPGLKNIDKPPVFVFPQVLICLVCGHAEFAVPETELRLLAKYRSAAYDVPGRGVPFSSRMADPGK